MSIKAMKQALEALEWNYNTDLDNIPACEQWAKLLKKNIPALRQAIADAQEADELTIAYMSGLHDGKISGWNDALDEAAARIANVRGFGQATQDSFAVYINGLKK